MEEGGTLPSLFFMRPVLSGYQNQKIAGQKYEPTDQYLLWT